MKLLIVFLISTFSWGLFAEEPNPLPLMQNMKVVEKSEDKSIPPHMMKDIMQVVEESDGKTVNINVIQKAYFYGPKKKRKRSPSSVTRTKVKKYQRDRLNLRSNFYYSNLDAKDTGNGGSATSASNENMGLAAEYLFAINRQSDMGFGVQGTFQSFNAPTGSTLDGDSALYFKLFGDMHWFVTPNFTITSGAGFQQMPYLTAQGTAASIEAATQPYISLFMENKWQQFLGIDLRTRILGEFLFGSFQGDIKANTGVTFGLATTYYFKVKGYQPNLTVFYRQASLQTTNTEQTAQELGLALGFTLPF